MRDPLRQKLDEMLTLADGIRVAPQIDPEYTQQIANQICVLAQEAMILLGQERIASRRNKARGA